ncbi:MAG: hypothetical protein WA077_08170 [Anaerolineae bacterium]
MDQIVDERRTNWLWIDNEVVDRFGPQIGAYGLAVYAVHKKSPSEDRPTSQIVRLLIQKFQM